MNVAARLEEYAKNTDQDFLISGVLAEQLSLHGFVAVDDLGQVELRGRTAPISVLAIKRFDC